MKNPKKKKSSKKYLAWRFPSFQKIRDNINLLISYPKFQEEVGKIRRRLDIPENKAGNWTKKWTNDMDKKSDEVMTDPKFIEQENRIREKLKKGEINVAVANKQSRLLYNKIPYNYLSDSVKIIIKKFHLPINYESFLHYYIITGKINIPTSNFTIGDFTGLMRDRKNLGYVPLKIFSKLSDEDLRELKMEVNSWFGKHLPKYQSLKDINKKIEVAKWHNNRIRYDEATGEGYKTGNKEIAQNLLGSKKKGNKVYEISRSIKKLQTNRFGKE